MSAATLNLTVEQYASFIGAISLTDASTNLPSNISGAIAKMSILLVYGRPPLLNLDSNGNGLLVHDSSDHKTDPSTVTISLTALQTSSFVVTPSPTVVPPVAKYYYDLILEYPSGDITRLVQGTLTVIGGITND